MMSKNISGLIKRNADLSAEKELNVKKALEKLKKSKKAFSVSEVCREAGVSRQYLHKHPDLLELVYKVQIHHLALERETRTLWKLISLY